MKSSASALVLKQTPAGRIKAQTAKPSGSKRHHHKGGGKHDAGGGHGDGTWIFSYADMITILMTFFILMLSISNVSVEKFDSLKESMKIDKTKDEQKKQTVEAPKELKNLANVKGPTLAGIPLEAVAEKAAATGGDRLAQLTAGVRILLDSVNRDLIAREELQAAEFDKLKSEVAKIAEVTAAAAATQGKRAELSVTLPAKEVFDAKGKLTPVAAKFLRDLVANAKSLETSPALRIETHANKLESSEPHKALQLTIAQASVLSSAVIAAGADPALVVAAGYGTTKPLVNEFDRYGKLVPGAVERNSRIVFFLERRPLDTDKIFEKNTNLRAKEIPK